MFGWRLVKHAFQMVVKNRQAALHIASWPLLVGLVGWLIFNFAFDYEFFEFGLGSSTLPQEVVGPQPMYFPKNSGLFFAVLVPFAIVMLALIMGAAVNWHRFILHEEETHWFMSPFRAGLSASYFLQWLRVFLILIIPVLIVSLAFAAIFRPWALSPLAGVDVGALPEAERTRLVQVLNWRIVIADMPSTIVIYWLFLKVAIALPAVAVGKSLGMAESFGLVKLGLLSTLVLVVLLAVLPSMLLWALAAAIPNTSVILIGDALLTPFLMFLNLSILTTLYGYFVEKRELV